METLETDSVLALVAIIFALLMAARAWKRGALSGIRALSGWVAGGAAGIWALNNGGDVVEGYTGVQLGPIAAFFCSIALAVLTFGVVRFLIRTFLHDLFGDDGPLAGYFQGPVGAVLSLLPTGAFLLLFCLLLRWSGTMMELGQIDEVTSVGRTYTVETYPKTEPLTNGRNAVERWPHANEILDFVDPVASVPKRNLVCILLASHTGSLRQELRKRPETAWVMGQPAVTVLIENDPELQQIVASGEFKYLRLLLHSRVQSTLRDPKLREELAKLDLPAEIKAVVTGQSGNKRKSWLQRIFS